jgi:hypothetical protein
LASLPANSPVLGEEAVVKSEVTVTLNWDEVRRAVFVWLEGAMEDPPQCQENELTLCVIRDKVFETIPDMSQEALQIQWVEQEK